MDDTTLAELLPALRSTIADPNASTDDLSRLAGLVLLEVARARRMPPDVARRSGAGLWRAAQDATPGHDPREELRTHARMVADLAAGVRR